MASSLALRLRTSNFAGSGGGGGTPVAGGTAIPPAYFGMHIGHATPTSVWNEYFASVGIEPGPYTQTPVPALPIGSVRLWDTEGCTWRNIERSKGAFVWDRLDYAVDLFDGKEIIFTLGCPPDWATAPAVGQVTISNPGLAGNYVGYNPHPPADLGDWSDWCAAVATRYAGRISHYEPWNEVNDAAFGSDHAGVGYTGTVEQLVEMATIMRETISAIDPAATFLSPNFTGFGLSGGAPGAVTLDTYLSAGGGDLADVVAIHGYSNHAGAPNPESILAHGAAVRSVMRSAGIHKPIWNDEWGLSGYVAANGGAMDVLAGAPPLDPSRAAGLVARTLICNWLAGYRRLHHFQLDWGSTATRMIDPNDRATLLAPATAWTYLAGLLTGGKLSALSTPTAPNGRRYFSARFTTANGRRGLILWLIDYPWQEWGSPFTAEIAMPAGVAEIRDVLGQETAIGATLTITGNPQYLFMVD